jgi:EmrB/QacA subfamily drug resistance transporter
VVTLEHVAENRVHERLLRGEAAVQGAGPDAGFARDLIHAGLEPVLEEEPTGGVEDPLTVGCRVAAQVRLARHGVHGSAKRRRLSGSDRFEAERRLHLPGTPIHATHPPRQHYNVTFAVLALAGAAFALLQSLVIPALGTIEDDLNASPTAGAWIITAYLLSASVATPIAGRIGDMFGKKRTLVVVLAVLALGTLISALATTIAVMIAGRIVQGIGGAVFPLAFAIIRDEFPREKVPVGIAMISSILGIGGGLGILLAGPIVEHLGYHWLFWLPLAAVAAAGIGALVMIPESPVKTPGRISWVGAMLLSSWLVALLVGVSEGHAWGWTSPRVLTLFALAAVLCAAWVVAESRSDHPLVDMQMMRQRTVWTTNLTAFLFGFGLFGSFILVPALVESPASSGVGFGASVTQAGLYLLPSTAGMLLVSPIAGRLSNRVGARIPLIAGSLVTAASFFVLVVAHDQPWQIYASSALLGIGLGLAFSSMANLIVSAVRPDQTGVATGMNTIMRSIGGSIGGQLSASILASSVAASGLPTEEGFTIAFLVSAVGLLLAVGAAVLIPRAGTANAAVAVSTVADAA